MRKSLLFLIVILALFSCRQISLDAEFVELKNINDKIILDIRYATENNFLNKAVYTAPRCFIRRKVAIKLDSIQIELEKIGLGLKVFDGYRPLSVQKMMWEILPDDRYVANPEHGSRHNRGAAVDVSLVDSNGVELMMPTVFNDFSERAAHYFKELPEKSIENRNLLKEIMEKYGFISLESEWWHYDLKNYAEYPVVDFSFDEIDRLNKQ